MLKLKRPHDALATAVVAFAPLPPSPLFCLSSFGNAATAPTPDKNLNCGTKRARPRGRAGDDVAMTDVEEEQENADVRAALHPFHSDLDLICREAEVLRPPPKKMMFAKRNLGEEILPPSIKTYTGDEVSRIVREEVDGIEKRIRAEYELVLQRKLQEQFASFSRFNEDSISRRIREREFTYVS